MTAAPDLPAETSGLSEIEEHVARALLIEPVSSAPLSAAREQRARDLLHASTLAVGEPGVLEYLAGALATIDELRRAMRRRNAETSVSASTEIYIASLERHVASLQAHNEQLRHRFDEARDVIAGWYPIDCLLEPLGSDTPVTPPRKRVALVGGPLDGHTCQTLEPLATTSLMIALRPGDERAAQYLVHAIPDHRGLARGDPPDGARLIGRYTWRDERAAYEWTESSPEGA